MFCVCWRRTFFTSLPGTAYGYTSTASRAWRCERGGAVGHDSGGGEGSGPRATDHSVLLHRLLRGTLGLAGPQSFSSGSRGEGTALRPLFSPNTLKSPVNWLKFTKTFLGQAPKTCPPPPFFRPATDLVILSS